MAFLITTLYACQSLEKKPGDIGKGYPSEKKYQVKSGKIVYETGLKTLSVNLTYKTIVYFDDYGMRERRDTYDSNHLSDTYLCDGEYLYQITHTKKRIYRTGKALHGTEPRFDWNKVSQADKDSGIAMMLPKENIAGKVCDVYVVKAGIATARFAGWKNILMLYEVKSPGGVNLQQAISIDTTQVSPKVFELPKNYRQP